MSIGANTYIFLFDMLIRFLKYITSLIELLEPRQKTLDIESACQMLELVLGDQPHASSFIRFLKVPCLQSMHLLEKTIIYIVSCGFSVWIS